MKVGRKQLPFIGCRVSAELLSYLEIEAKRDQRPLGNLVRKILSEWQEDHAAKRVPRANGREQPLIKSRSA